MFSEEVGFCSVNRGRSFKSQWWSPQDFFCTRPDVAKMYTYSDAVEFGAPDEYFDHPVVAVDPCAVARVSPQAVTAEKWLNVSAKTSAIRSPGIIRVCPRIKPLRI